MGSLRSMRRSTVDQGGLKRLLGWALLAGTVLFGGSASALQRNSVERLESSGAAQILENLAQDAGGSSQTAGGTRGIALR
jgi:hypothetical protein